jgi:ubiquinone biosynthesis protein
MVEVLVTILLSLLFAVVAAWITQHVLGTPIGWIRAIIAVAILYAITVPVARTALEAGDVMQDGQLEVSGAMGAVFIALTLGWQLALGVAVIMLLELFWPTGRGWHPIRTIRGLIRRRNRMIRYGQTLRIASKYGLSLYSTHRRGDDEDIDVPRALVAAMNEAGVTFVKIGQVLSTRDDILPDEFTEAFATLQMQSTPLPWTEVRTAIEAELPGTIDETFEWIDEAPLAAASLAQVHVARLRLDGPGEGPRVVVKIQRPDARRSVELDSDIIVRLAAQAERRTSWARSYGLSALAEEFVRSLREELDYRIELSNMTLLRDTLQRSSVRTIHVPDAYPQLCTPRMMVQELVEGTPFSNLAGDLPADVAATSASEHGEHMVLSVDGATVTRTDTYAETAPTARDIADSLVDSTFEQIAVRGIFHADLHPGNIILRPDGELTLIDFGSVGILEKSMRRTLVAMMAAIAAEDDIALTDLILMIVGDPADGSTLDRGALQREIGVVLARVRNARTSDGIFRQVIDVLRRHQLSMPPALLLVFRTIGSLEGTLRQLVPDYDMIDQALTRTPHFARLAINPAHLLAEARVQLQVGGEMLRRIPRRIETIGSQLEKGTFGLDLRMFRDPRERGWVGSLVGQLTTALVGVALVVSAVLLVVSDDGPLLTPNVGLLPFIGAVLGLAGMLLVLRILRVSLMKPEGQSASGGLTGG